MDKKVLLPRPADLEALDRLRKWLPAKIIDCHFHCHGRYAQPLFDPQATMPSETFNWFSWELHQDILSQMGLWSAIYEVIAFGLPERTSEEANLSYIRGLADKDERFHGIACLSRKECIEKFNNFLNQPPFILKTKIRAEGRGQEIINHFPKELWEFWNARQGFLLIHLPDNIFANADELVFLSRKYRNIIFIIAHLGNAFIFQEAFSSAFKKVAVRPNIWLDVSMVTDVASLNSAISILGCRRILFGSDAPFAYLHGKMVNYEGKAFFQSDSNWPWVKPALSELSEKQANSLKMVYIDNLYAIRQGLVDSGQDKAEKKELIFYANSKNLLRGS